MIALPGRNTRVTRALLWLAAITALFLFGAPRAGAEEKASGSTKTTSSRPPVSAAAVEASKDSKPSPAPSSKESVSKSVTATPNTTDAAKSGTESDGNMTLRAGQDRTDFRSMTIEGEDRVQVEVERPELALELDAEKVPG